MSPELQGIVRSLRIYHGDADRRDRMDKLHRQFFQAGDLVFDIGAHVGDRTMSFLRLGARVVALEPNPLAFRALGLCLMHHTGITRTTLLRSACGSQTGRLKLLTNSRNPTVATASPEFVSEAAKLPAWAGEEWDGQIEVPCVTLDRLINTYGVPAFVKIDVEGFEDHVLAGLTRQVRGLSFEVTTNRRIVAMRCLERLPNYRFNISFQDNERLQLRDWLDRDSMMSYIHVLPRMKSTGDIYAKSIR